MYKDLNIRDFTGVKDLVNTINEIYDNINWDNYYFISVCGKRKFITEVALQLLNTDGHPYHIGVLDFTSREDDTGDYYNDEFSLYIMQDGKVSIDYARNDDNVPYNCFQDIIFFYQEECSQDVIDNALKSEDNIVTLFGFDGEEKQTSTVKREPDDIYRAVSDITHSVQSIISSLGDIILSMADQ